MKQVYGVGLALALAGTALAGGNGGSAGAFLTLPAGARSAAMGEGGVADTVDANALQINPAAMAVLGQASVVGTHGTYIDSSSFDAISYVNPKSKIGAWGVGVQYFSAGSIDRTDNAGNPDGSLTPKDMALTGGYARPMGPVVGGIGVKYIKSTLVDSASALSLDLGVESRGLMNNRLTLGLVGQNLVGSLKYDAETNPLPRQIKVGAGYEVKKNWTAVADLVFPKDADSWFSLGTEYGVKVYEPWGLALRGGYNTRTSDVDGFAGFTLGLGVTHKALSVDYAYLPFGDIGTTHWVTLGWKFEGGSK